MWACVVRPHAVEVNDRYRETRISGPDPNPSVEFLRSGPTLSYDILVFRFYEAAVRDLRRSAKSGHRWLRSNAVNWMPLEYAIWRCHLLVRTTREQGRRLTCPGWAMNLGGTGSVTVAGTVTFSAAQLHRWTSSL